MYIRTIASTIALAAGLFVILALAFVVGIPAYLMGRSLKRPRDLASTLHRTPAPRA